MQRKITLQAALLITLLPLSQSFASPQNIAVIGTGYVGSVLGACLASFNNKVVCVDTNKETIEKLKRGEMTIYEPGLEEMIARYTQNNSLSFSDDPASAIRNSDIIFIAVGTPMTDDGNANLNAIESVARTIGENLNGYKVICTKSTVPIGTGARIKQIIKNYSQNSTEFDIVSNPEFLREGSSIYDFLNPDRVIIGLESERPYKALYDVYEPLHKRAVPFVFTNIESAEAIKYASNAFLAVKITFINEIANLCERVGADVLQVAKGMGLDKRIGSQFLTPGPGYGGSCFPKDVQALLFKGNQVALDLKVTRAAKESNSEHKLRIFEKLSKLLGNDLSHKKVAVLGLAFKSNTDDIRESSSIDIIQKLIENKARVSVYDPEAMDNMKKLFPNIEYNSSTYDAIKDADAIVLLTEWDEFRLIDLAYVRKLAKQALILDARNILSTTLLKKLNFTFENIGNATVSTSSPDPVE
ncbi:UDP-glucose/GDP-mannose dehydrogenase family protein [Candidatus Dependentiae bacterium]|nr:UDP-glucose/GDP-mannose dehydrogenase family protein [Candidatus Dependentiae bacterium]